MLYSHNQGYPSEGLPHRIVLSNGSTRTDSSTFTDAEISDAGYVGVETAPSYNSRSQRLEWTGTDWYVVGLSTAEIDYITFQEWSSVRLMRNKMIDDIEWRISRYQSELRLGITTTTDSISDLDTYVQELRDVTNQSDPFSIVWPNPPA